MIRVKFIKSFCLLVFCFIFVACYPEFPGDEYGDSPYGKYSIRSMEYFLEIGLCTEFQENCDPKVRKWESGIIVAIHGSYTDEDYQEVQKIMSELQQLTGLAFTLANNSNLPNMNIYFTTQEGFTQCHPKYDEMVRREGLQRGLFTFDTNNDNDGNIIIRANICIDQSMPLITRHHLLREEMTQSLGIGNDSTRYPGSIFQQNWDSKPRAYTEIDKEVIQILYDTRVLVGMTPEQVKQALTESGVTQVASN